MIGSNARRTVGTVVLLVVGLVGQVESDQQTPDPEERDHDATVTDDITRHDTPIWDNRDKDKRKVLVAISIPSDWDGVVIEPTGDSELADSGLEFLVVDSVRIPDPSNVDHIELRSGDRRSGDTSAWMPTMVVLLKRCARLDLGVWNTEERAGGARRVLRQKDEDLPDCCIRTSSLSALPEG